MKQQKKQQSPWNGDEVVAFLKTLPRVQVSLEGEGNYSFQDRAKDFLEVFSTEQGRRVLSQIHQICDFPPTIEDADQPGKMAFKNGMRRVFAEIQLCMAGRNKVVIETQPQGE